MTAPTTTAATAIDRLVDRRAPRTLLLLLELLLLAVVVEQTRLISPAFVRLFQVTVAGVFLNEFVPGRLRPPFFLVLSFVGAAVVVNLVPAVALFAAGLVIVGVCHLPLRLPYRAVLLGGIGALAAAWQVGVEGLPTPPVDILLGLPILASMFMFRGAIFLYDRENARKRPPFVQTLNYFFMLPNVCFPLFPCIDYTTFLRSYREGDEERWRVQQQGIYWIVEGTLHLLALRLVELYVVRDPGALTSRLDHLLYVVSAYALYLRVSGQFHIAVGVLQLFGYELPRTHNRYFLASSFTDLWRRINIYWMEFMRKMVYFPIALRLRRWGEPWASGVATVCVFASTLVLHAYQFFWLSGSFRISPRDVVFWGALCLLVLFDMQRERRALARRRAVPKAGESSAPSILVRMTSTGATLLVMTVLWSLWSSEAISFGRWLSILRGVVAP